MGTWVAEVCPQTRRRIPKGGCRLAEHLRELRNRLAKALLAIVVVTVAAAFFYQEIINFLTEPILESIGCEEVVRGAGRGRHVGSEPCAQITINGLLGPLHPGAEGVLDRRRRAGLAGLSSTSWQGVRRAQACTSGRRSTPTPSSPPAPRCSSIGALSSTRLLPTSAEVLIEFTPSDVDTSPPRWTNRSTTVTRMALRLRPLLRAALPLVMLNLTGVLTGRAHRSALVAIDDHGDHPVRLLHRHAQHGP